MRRTAGALALVAAVILGVSADGDAGPAPTARIGPQFPETVIVGETFLATIVLQNLENSPVVFRDIQLLPACDPPLNCPEPNVMRLSPSGTGIAGPRRCRGSWAIKEISPGVFGFTPPLRQSAISLDPGVYCIVRFSVTVLRMPSDALPATATQTVQYVQAARGPVAAYTTAVTGSDYTTVVISEPAMGG